MQVPSDWWRNFFSGLALEITPKIYPAEFTRAEADFITQQLGLTQSSAVLDVPCGDGRLSLELAGRGFRLTGVDLVGALIETARGAALRRRVSATFETHEMRDLPWREAFDAAFCFGNSFAYLDDEGNTEFLRAITRSLRPGGRFLLDYPAVAEALLPHLEKRTWYPVGDVLMLAQREYDPARGRLDVEYTFIRGDNVEKRPASYRIYTYRQLCELLAEAGLVQPVGYGSLAGEPFALGARGLYVLTIKA
ncbi:MAG TPA: class I SAM-dependent methyltransferase [Phycisphaerae bacterium]